MRFATALFVKQRAETSWQSHCRETEKKGIRQRNKAVGEFPYGVSWRPYCIGRQHKENHGPTEHFLDSEKAFQK